MNVFLCGKICMNAKICNRDHHHTICYSCLNQCQFCNNYISHCCQVTNITYNVLQHNHDQQFKCHVVNCVVVIVLKQIV